MFPFWIDLEMSSVVQMLAGSVAAVVWLITFLTGHFRGI